MPQKFAANEARALPNADLIVKDEEVEILVKRYYY